MTNIKTKISIYCLKRQTVEQIEKGGMVSLPYAYLQRDKSEISKVLHELSYDETSKDKIFYHRTIFNYEFSKTDRGIDYFMLRLNVDELPKEKIERIVDKLITLDICNVFDIVK